jgi:hypothetical protein
VGRYRGVADLIEICAWWSAVAATIILLNWRVLP